MIFRQTRLVVADNTGARVAQCIGMLGHPQDEARIGRVIKVAIKEIKSSAPNLKVKPGQVHNALVIRQRQQMGRSDGRVLRFDDNAVVLLTPDMKPLGTRVVGPVPQELRKGNWLKILSLSSKVI
jgi:large subunit ribosomal protein L14